MKPSFLFLCFSLTVILLSIAGFSLAQNTRDSAPPVKRDSLRTASPVIGRDTAVHPKKPDSPRIVRPLIRRTDTLSRKPDTVKAPVDTVGAGKNTHRAVGSPNERLQRNRISYNDVLRQQPYFNFFGKPLYRMTLERRPESKDLLFYLLLGVVCYFALVKLIFGKYFSNLFAVFFNVSLKQKQIREQLLQSQLPSLLMNIFFVICGGIYAAFLLQHYRLAPFPFWSLILYCTLGLSLIYLVKFLVLKLMGWVFNIMEATDTYIFVVFLVNKLIGMFLVPFIILLPFSERIVVQVLITLSLTMIGILFAYRYMISYSPVRKEIRVSQFHFFLYLCAFELAPLLLIYKVLLNFLEKSS